MSAFQSRYGGQFTLSTPLINQIFVYHSPTDAAPQFLQKLIPFTKIWWKQVAKRTGHVFNPSPCYGGTFLSSNHFPLRRRTLKTTKRIIHLILWLSLIISKNRPFFEIFIYFVPFLAVWSIWSSCSHKCQVGSRSRSRTVVTVELWGGRCPHQLSETGSCGIINGGCEQICNPSSGQCTCKAGYIAAGKVLIIIVFSIWLLSLYSQKKSIIGILLPVCLLLT